MSSMNAWLASTAARSWRDKCQERISTLRVGRMCQDKARQRARMDAGAKGKSEHRRGPSFPPLTLARPHATIPTYPFSGDPSNAQSQFFILLAGYFHRHTILGTQND